MLSPQKLDLSLPDSAPFAIGVRGPLKGQSFKRWRRSSETPKAYSADWSRRISAVLYEDQSSMLTLPTIDLVIGRERNTFLEAAVRVGRPANIVTGHQHAHCAVEICK